ncbi:metal-dependent hydrolase [Fictibacillus fluitans]|uniref:Metal-dependent hydrolase n=1 Tax=Fictibacillus fluitans TaxID=3058422 RepID=A0ABT8HQ52_9BACL|nr:metal-dependent hydrolase [Fictibacillus sp. NE201]MDN4522889.1 metal-dependent hydrolase [Fictibacillus sp. NE201]
MKGNTHIMGGLAAAALANQWIAGPASLDHQLVYYGAGILGSLLPDLCHPHSWVGKKTKLVSKLVSKTFGHRTITHSWLFIIGTIWVSNLLQTNYSPEIKNGLVAGVISHLILDACTSRGIQFLYPIHIRFRSPVYTKTGSSAETAISGILMIAACALLAKEHIFHI